MTTPTTIAAINKQNRDFWSSQQIEAEQLMADRAILDTALELVDSELRRQVPVYSQMTLGAALQEARRAKQRFLGQMARAGGKSKKADTLQDLIEAMVERNPAVSAKQVLKQLRQHEGGEVIQEIGDTSIWFTNRIGSSDETTISALPNRLTRAKKKISLTGKR